MQVNIFKQRKSYVIERLCVCVRGAMGGVLDFIEPNCLFSGAHDKTIQCNEKDFPSSQTKTSVLMIRLPRRLIKSLVEQQRKPMTSKLKVQLSSELLQRLFQSVSSDSTNERIKPSSIDKLTIASDYGPITATINHKDSIDCSDAHAVQARIQLACSRPMTVRHQARSRRAHVDRTIFVDNKHEPDGNPSTSRIVRRMKRHVHVRSCSSHDNILSQQYASTAHEQDTSSSNEHMFDRVHKRLIEK
jgi:hypothetical protein